MLNLHSLFAGDCKKISYCGLNLMRHGVLGVIKFAIVKWHTFVLTIKRSYYIYMVMPCFLFDPINHKVILISIYRYWQLNLPFCKRLPKDRCFNSNLPYNHLNLQHYQMLIWALVLQPNMFPMHPQSVANETLGVLWYILKFYYWLTTDIWMPISDW